MIECIKNLIKAGLKIKSNDDDRTIEVEFLGKKQVALMIVPYGMHIKAPNETLTILFQQEGNEESLLAYLTDPDNYDTLDEKEVAFGVPTLKHRIKFTKDDTIKFNDGDKDGGDFAARFDELKAGFDELKDDFNSQISTYNSHTHPVPGITPGPGSTTSSATTSSGSSSSASIDDAKIDTIEFPEKS